MDIKESQNKIKMLDELNKGKFDKENQGLSL